MVAVMGLFADSNTSAAGSLQQQESALVQKLNAYWLWAQNDPKVVGLNVWHWIDIPPALKGRRRARGNPATEYNVGTESLPLVIARLEEIRA